VIYWLGRDILQNLRAGGQKGDRGGEGLREIRLRGNEIWTSGGIPHLKKKVHNDQKM